MSEEILDTENLFLGQEQDLYVSSQTYNELIADIEIKQVDKSIPRQAREVLEPVRKKLNWQDTEFNNMTLSLTEVLSNLVDHPEVKPTEIRVLIYQDAQNNAMLNISDNGSSFFNFEQEKEQSLIKIKEDSLSERGRGLALIQKMHPDHCYLQSSQSMDGLNHFTFWHPTRDYIKKRQKQKPKLILVDDDRALLFLLEKMLGTHYEVFTFESAFDALDQFETIDPDIVISDLNMPGMDGIELRQELTKKKNGNLTPFIFFSTNVEASTHSYINDLGIDDYLIKPVKKEKLISVIDRLLSRSKQVKDGINGKVGKEITSVLRPSLPSEVQGWKTVVKTITADTGGGDCLFLSEADKGAAMILADVMGHGVEAKFFAYAFAGYLRSLFNFFKDKDRPEKVLKAFSDVVNEDILLEQTIITGLTLWLTKTGRIDFSSAAHPKPYLISASGDVTEIDVMGPLPGLAGNCAYMRKSYQLQEGDRIVLITDGMIESGADLKKQEENEKRLIEKIRQCFDQDINDAAFGVWDFYLNTIRKNQKTADDATLVLLEYGGKK